MYGFSPAFCASASLRYSSVLLIFFHGVAFRFQLQCPVSGPLQKVHDTVIPSGSVLPQTQARALGKFKERVDAPGTPQAQAVAGWPHPRFPLRSQTLARRTLCLRSCSLAEDLLIHLSIRSTVCRSIIGMSQAITKSASSLHVRSPEAMPPSGPIPSTGPRPWADRFFCRVLCYLQTNKPQADSHRHAKSLWQKVSPA